MLSVLSILHVVVNVFCLYDVLFFCYLFWYVVKEIAKKKVWQAGPPTRQPANKRGGVEFWAHTSKFPRPIFGRALGGSDLNGAGRPLFHPWLSI
jgi:hypothetical protein